jgi:hypothetical protein
MWLATVRAARAKLHRIECTPQGNLFQWRPQETTWRRNVLEHVSRQHGEDFELFCEEMAERLARPPMVFAIKSTLGTKGPMQIDAPPQGRREGRLYQEIPLSHGQPRTSRHRRHGPPAQPTHGPRRAHREAFSAVPTHEEVMVEIWRYNASSRQSLGRSRTTYAPVPRFELDRVATCPR